MEVIFLGKSGKMPHKSLFPEKVPSGKSSPGRESYRGDLEVES